MIARTIQQQLGNRALFMLGAHSLLDCGDGLSFRFKGSRRVDERKVNYCKITLDPTDTYTVEFWKLGRAVTTDPKLVSKTAGIYCDQLHTLIETETGLYTSL